MRDRARGWFLDHIRFEAIAVFELNRLYVDGAGGRFVVMTNLDTDRDQRGGRAFRFLGRVALLLEQLVRGWLAACRWR